MRFRLIEKDTLGTGTEFVQADKKTRANSKTYIGSNRKKKVDMNKIKNTKIGDDIHYYINGTEGRGIVVKMANEYLEIFKENGQLGTIHINDTFFVKDILINKQWDDMEDTEKYSALMKIHAPSPRYITKRWSDIPDEIKILLRKEGGNMAGGTGSTYEKGESKDSETQDHARTGFAQNTQYAKKGLCEVHKMADCPHCGKDVPGYKGPAQKKARWVDPRTGAEDWTEHSYRYDRESKAESMKKTHLPSEHIGHPDYFNKEKNPMWNKRQEVDPEKLDKTGNRYGKGHHKVHHPDDPVSERNQKKGYNTNYSKAGKEAEYRAKRRNAYNIHEKEKHEAADESKYQDYKKYRDEDKKKNPRQDVAANQESEYEKQLQEAWGQGHSDKKEEPKKEEPKKDKPSGGFVTEDDYDKGNTNKSYYVNKGRPNPRRVEGERGASFGTTQGESGQAAQQNFRDTSTAAAGAVSNALTGGGGGSDSASTTSSTGGSSTRHQANVTRAYEVWLERRQEWISKKDLKDYVPTEEEIRSGKKKRRSNHPITLEDKAKQDSEDTKPNEGAKELARAKELREGDTKPNEGAKELARGKPVGRITHRDGTTTPVYRDEEKDVRTRFAEHKKNPGKRSFKKSDESDKAMQFKTPDDPKKPKKTIMPEPDPPKGGGDRQPAEGEGKSPRKPRGHEPGNQEGAGETPDKYKSDVEHGHYGNVGGAPDVFVSTDTKVDVTTGTGYEERPHISVEEAGKLPRGTFNESGSELTVSGSQDSKDEPKFSQPHSQETVRKVGLPEQHPNTYGVRYGMKGGVKKVWCPEHQMWEETRKDWHE